MKKALWVLALGLGASLLGPPAGAHVDPDHSVWCDVTVYEPVEIEGYGGDKIVAGIKHQCYPSVPDWIDEQAQIQKLDSRAFWQNYGAPMNYRCGLGGQPGCKNPWTTFDWVYCPNASGTYRNRGWHAGFHGNPWTYGPVWVPPLGKYIKDCRYTGPQGKDGTPLSYTPQQQEMVDEFVRQWELGLIAPAS